MTDQLNQPLSPRPVRLVFLLQDLKYGGTQRQALELARRLNPSRFQTEVWLMKAGDDLAPLARGWGVPLVWLSRREEVGPVCLANLWRRLKREAPDVLLLLTVVPNIWGRILGRLAPGPVIVGNCRGGAAPKRQHERWLWPLADHIFCNSLALKARLTNHYAVPSHRLTVIPNGVDTDFFKPPAAARRPGPPRVLSIGRLVPDKDHDTLIKAFRLVATEHPQAELWLVGEGPREAALKKLVQESRLSDKVRFLPGQADVRPLMHQASLLVLSSIAEALPNVVLEAMAAGLPVVATRVGGLPEVVMPGETGWLVPPRDIPALAAGMSHLLADPKTRRAFGLAGRKRVEREFSFMAMVRSHEEVLLHFLARDLAEVDKLL
ncbi:MAG: GT4 family glycosyltransferase PelF [Desulfobaccales bacterium]|nr:GT4 family glycosyltransferase PelF [Desulfobaccales bacterium]